MGLDEIIPSRLGCARSFDPKSMMTMVDVALAHIENILGEFRKDMLSRHNIPENESGLTESLVPALDGSNRPGGLIFKAESQENCMSGNSPAVDIGILWEISGQASSRWPRVSTIEAKRLNSTLDSRRKREYVYGHNAKGKHIECGGIERYKKSIHANDVSSKVVLLGYMQTDDFSTWHCRVNDWIGKLAEETGHCPAWNFDEKLGEVKENDGVGLMESLVLRKQNKLTLIHLWVDLTCD